MEKNLDVIYEDNHVIVVVKPHNVPAQEDDTKDVLNEFIKEAYDLYKYANISEYLSEISE